MYLPSLLDMTFNKFKEKTEFTLKPGTGRTCFRYRICPTSVTEQTFSVEYRGGSVDSDTWRAFRVIGYVSGKHVFTYSTDCDLPEDDDAVVRFKRFMTDNGGQT